MIDYSDENARLSNPVGLIIIDSQGRVLLLHRTEDEEHAKWGVPGGGSEPGESFEEALVREVKEEIGCEIETLQYFRSYFERSPRRNIRSVYFTGAVKGTITLNSEHDEYEWCTKEQVFARELAFNLKQVLEELFAQQKDNER